jgi:hypothetical protein
LGGGLLHRRRDLRRQTVGQLVPGHQHSGLWRQERLLPTAEPARYIFQNVFEKEPREGLILATDQIEKLSLLGIGSCMYLILSNESNGFAPVHPK